MLTPEQLSAEWLETDGLGGFSSGTVGGWRSRRYHGVLTPAVKPPTLRAVLVAGFEAWVETDGVRTAISSQRYGPDFTHPDGYQRIRRFTIDPWPMWSYTLPSGAELIQELFVPHETAAVALRWQLKKPRLGMRLVVRPFLAGRDSHSIHHENSSLNPDARQTGERTWWQPYGGFPEIQSLANASYRHEPTWYRNFVLDEERNRGFDAIEELWSPGELTWDLSGGGAVWMLSAQGLEGTERFGKGRATDVATRLAASEHERRAAFPSRLHRAADAYIVRRGAGKTIIAGYPWFTDWGRDTFIALRGLCLAGGRLDDAKAILLEWAGAVAQGMLPNRFVEEGDAPEFNSVDASLWYVIAVHEFRARLAATRKKLSARDQLSLETAVDAILTGYAEGTRFGIGMDSDGLIRAGVPGVQLTWMDARVGDWVVTPRIGKPVEIQALWLNALRIAGASEDRWAKLYDRAVASFRARFWNPAGYLHDVVDPDGRMGEADATFRPNQLYAVGGLPFPVLDPERARQVVDAVEARLWTPLGPRSLAPGEPNYAPHYEGGPVQRDGSYHQGTVWPYLAGPFVEAWVRVRGDTDAARREARQRFFAPIMAHLDSAGLGHVSEIADAEPPHMPRGCPFQAWSLGELLRLDQQVLALPSRAPKRKTAKAGK